MAATPIDLSKAVQKALEDLYRRKVDPHTEIQSDLFKGFVDTFDLAVTEGFKDSPAVSYDFKERILHSNEVFSAFKVHRMQEDMAARLLDSEGNLKSFEQFAQDVKDITSHQCRQWLRTEYDTAIKRAQLAADWQRFEDEKDVLPNLRWVPSTAANPSADHMVFWDTVKPIDDPFWSAHKPGDHWGCQCSLEATDEPATATPRSGQRDEPAPGLENNPGKDGELFSDKHPYFPDSCQDCPFNKGGGRMGFTNLSKEDCARCAGLEDILSMLREKRKEEDLSPQMMERLKEYWELSKNPDYQNVEFNEENGGIKATHISHKRERRDDEKVYKDLTGKQLEKNCQNTIFRKGGSCILEAESLRMNGQWASCIDATIMGERMDIASITKSEGNIIFNSICRKEEQLMKFNKTFGANAHSLALYFEDPAMFNEQVVKDALARYLGHVRYHGAINTVYCVLNDSTTDIIVIK